MNSFELLDSANIALEEIFKHKELLGALNTIASKIDDIAKLIPLVASNDTSKLSNAAQTIRNSISELKNNNSVLSPRTIFTQADSLRKTLANIKESTPHDPDLISSGMQSIESFSNAYENYIRNYTVPQASALAFAAKDLITDVEKIIHSYELIKVSLFKKQRKQGTKDISIYLSDIYDVKDFANKLNAISQIYEAVANLTNTSLTEHPLLIEHIESGSLWAKLAGYPEIIKFLIDCLQSGAAYVHRNFTTEGKLSTIPNKLDSLNSIIDPTKKLEELGVDTEETKEEIRKSAHTIGKALNQLLDAQYKIKINGKEQSIPNSLRRELTHEKWRERPKIEHSEEKEHHEEEQKNNR